MVTFGAGAVRSLLARNGALLAGTETRGVFISTNDGTSWAKLNTGIKDTGVMCVRTYAVIDSVVFARVNAGNIYRFTNNQTPWTEVADATPPNWRYSNFTLVAKGKNLFAGTSGLGVFLSTDYGASWTRSSNGLRDTSYVQTLAVSGDNIFAGIASGGNIAPGGIFLSADNGASWENVNTLFGESIYLWKLFGKGAYLLAGTEMGLYRSGDSGANFTKVLNNAKGPIVFEEYGGIIFTGFQSGIFLSADTGATWTPLDTGIRPSDLAMMDFKSLAVGDNYLFAGTFHGEVMRLPLSQIATSIHADRQASRTLPTFRAHISTIGHSGVLLTYSLASRCFVQAEIYSLSGKRAAVLEQKEQMPGNYTLRLDNKNLPGGLYICRFKAGDNQISSRIIIGGR
jgi:photosystem II stability/assembly factor-like uncharacterized protein